MPRQRQAKTQQNLNAITNRELLQRLNFLYQSSAYLQSLASSSSDESKATINVLSRAHGETVISISKKAQIKLTPSMKRSICQSCRVVLQTGLTASVRVKACKAHGTRISTTCFACGTCHSVPRSLRSIGDAIVDLTVTNDEVKPATQPDDQASRRFTKHRPRRRPEHTSFLDREGHIFICGNNNNSIKCSDIHD